MSGPHLRVRAELMEALCRVIRGRGLRQREAALLFGVAQPRVSDLVRGKVALFSIDTLVDMLAAVDITVDVVLRARHGRGRTLGAHGRSPAALGDRPGRE